MDALGRFAKGRAVRSNGFIALDIDEPGEEVGEYDMSHVQPGHSRG